MRATGSTLKLATRDAVRELLGEASKAAGHHKFSLQFLLTEWEQVVDAWQLQSWEGYREVARLGRKTRLPEPQRAVLWTIFEQVRSGLARRNLITYSGLFSRLASAMEKSKHPPFEFAVLDEAQDLSISQLRFLAALGANRSSLLDPQHAHCPASLRSVHQYGAWIKTFGDRRRKICSL